MIQNIVNWVCIFSFAITLVTLLTTLNIRGKIDRTLGKQRFLQQREKIVADFTAVRQNVLRTDEKDRPAMEPFLLDLRALALQLSHFHIWSPADRKMLQKFIRLMSQAYMPDKPGEKVSGKELVMRVDEIVAIVKAQAEV